MKMKMKKNPKKKGNSRAGMPVDVCWNARLHYGNELSEIQKEKRIITELNFRRNNYSHDLRTKVLELHCIESVPESCEQKKSEKKKKLKNT